MRPGNEDLEDEQAEEENKIINEEYKLWKKNSPFLYDAIVTTALSWPSLTCQWFPDKESPPNKPYTVHRLLLGTHTSGQAQDYLQIATVQIGKRDESAGAERLDHTSYDDERGELGGHTLSTQPKITVTQRINHPGEVNRARYMPQNPDLIATKAVSGEVLVWDRTRHSSDPDRSGAVKPDMRLVGQTKEGFGLAWNPVKSGNILGASEDMTVCHWDVNMYSKGKNSIEPVTVYSGHESVVGDVDWHAKEENIFASVGDDKKLMFWDIRSGKSPYKSFQAHDKEILSVAWSPANENLIITGGADKTVALWDRRKEVERLHTFEFHNDEVLQLAWSPHNETVFASASSDRRILVWDLAQIGIEQSPDDAEDGPPELLFMHGGHTSRPADFSWAPGESESWHIASVSEDNVLQVWSPSRRIWAGEEVEVDVRELEADAMEGVESTTPAESSKAGKAKEE
ncbi:histone acetyltransferase type B subunit 2 [Phellopilus nigrolimitatus]|nr:histone acetyltransferase type B subunit 2 [Phellopilus nigrolimitatus]KAH8101342.1 histone acetyltransferase type B subunit 2 [Phellopilus nigrolimitatus]